MATSAELLDIPIDYEFEGKTFKVSRIITQEMEVFLADWVYQSAIDRLERQRSLARQRGFGMSEDQYERQLNRIGDNQQAGKYEWEGSITVEAMNQIPGNKMMTFFRFKRYDPTVQMSLIDKIFESIDDLRKLGRLLNPTQAGGSEQKKESDATPAANS